MRFQVSQATFFLLAAISSTSFGQTLNDILQGIVEVNPATAMATPVMQKMAPHNGTPDEVFVWKLHGVDHNDPYCFDGRVETMTPVVACLDLYASCTQGRGTLSLLASLTKGLGELLLGYIPNLSSM